MRTRPARYSVIIGIAVLIAGCVTAVTDKPTSTETATVSTAIGSDSNPTSVPLATTTTDTADAAKRVDIAARFMTARQDRDLEQALSYLDASAFMDWGPGRTFDTLEAGLAWEDAFGIEFTLDYCEPDPYNPAEEPIGCRLEVRTLVNDINTADTGTDDSETDAVCVAVTVERLITRAELGSGAGCEFSFWETTFLPFYEWMNEAHPGVLPDDMYDDRISPQGLQLWTQMTNEYVQANTP